MGVLHFRCPIKKNDCGAVNWLVKSGEFGALKGDFWQAIGQVGTECPELRQRQRQGMIYRLPQSHPETGGFAVYRVPCIQKLTPSRNYLLDLHVY